MLIDARAETCKSVERDPSLRETVETICKTVSLISEGLDEIDEKLFKGKTPKANEPSGQGELPPSVNRYLKETVIELFDIHEHIIKISKKIAED